jgi:transcriptional regulator with XRE-family HTH domain
MTQGDLARCSGVGLNTVMRFERSERVTKPETVEALRRALEARGIIFANGDRPSVTLDKAKAIIPV